MSLKSCVQAGINLDDADVSAVMEGVDAYSQTMPDQEAVLLATQDAITSVSQERVSTLSEIRRLFPDLVPEPTPAPAVPIPDDPAFSVVRVINKDGDPEAKVRIDRDLINRDAPHYGYPTDTTPLADNDPRLEDTKNKFTVPGTKHADLEGEPAYTPERMALHEKWIAEALEDGTTGQENEEEEGSPYAGQPVAILMGGGGASGKGTLLKLNQSEGVVPVTGFVHADPDGIKTKMDEYGDLVDELDSRAAAVVHEESSDVTKIITNRAIAGKMNIIIDKTLNNEKKALAQIKMLKDAGYKVRLIGVTLDIDEALIRALGRYYGSARLPFVPAMVDAHIQFNKHYENLAKAVDVASIYDNSGETPALVLSAQAGQVEINNQNLYDATQLRGTISAENETLRSVETPTRNLLEEGDGRGDNGTRQRRAEAAARNERTAQERPAEIARAPQPGEFIQRSTQPKAQPKTHVSVAHLRNVRSNLARSMPITQKLDIHIYEKQDDYFGPNSAANPEIGIVEGGFIAGTNQMLLFAENLKDKQAANTLVRHEVVGHFGFRELLNRDGAYDRILNRVYQGRNAELKKEYDWVARYYPKLVKDGNVAAIADEMIARASETKTAATRLMTKIYDEIIKLLNQFGLVDGLMTQKELKSLVRTSEANLRQRLANEVAPRSPDSPQAVMARQEALEYDMAVAKGLDMSADARRERAEEQGYDIDTVWYHGSPEAQAIADDNGFVDSDHYGVTFFSEEPTEASYFTRQGEGGGIFPVYLKARNTFDYNSQNHLNQVTEILREGGVDQETIDNLEVGDYEALEDEMIQQAIFGAGFDSFYVKENPSDEHRNIGIPGANARSINAAFDPDFTDADGLLNRQERTEYEQAVDKGLDMTRDARTARAKKQGFDVDTTYYHGTVRDFAGFAPPGQLTQENRAAVGKIADELWEKFAAKNRAEASPEEREVFEQWIAQGNKPGRGDIFQQVASEMNFGPNTTRTQGGDYFGGKVHFFSASTEVANGYSKPLRRGEDGGLVIPVHIKKGKALEIDAAGRDWRYYLDDIRDAPEKGYESVILSNFIDSFTDQGGILGTSVAVFNPSSVRSVNAAYDPDFQDSSNLLMRQEDQVKTPEFKAWFGKSQVVENGQPKVMYRGERGDSRSYRPNDKGIIYLAGEEALADQFAKGGMGMPIDGSLDAVTQAVYVKAENIIDVINNKKHRELFMDLYAELSLPEAYIDGKRTKALEGRKKLARAYEPRIKEGAWSFFEKREMIDRLKAEGFDGFWNYEYPLDTVPNQELALGVFSGDQMKSATDNNGDFDPTNPNMRFRANDSVPLNNFLEGSAVQVPVYHGTEYTAGFTEFQGKQFYFSPEKVAETYSGTQAEAIPGGNNAPVDRKVAAGGVNAASMIRTTPGNYKVYLSLKNPLVLNAPEVAEAGKLPKPGQVKFGKPQLWSDPINGHKDMDAAVEAARESGKYDGVIVNNIWDEGRYSDSAYKKPGTVYVAFSANQVKSVDHNSGAYDPNNPDMRFRRVDDLEDAPVGTNLGMPEETTFEHGVRWFQDAMNRMLKAQEVLAERGGDTTGDKDVYRAEELHSGKISIRGRNLQRDYMDPLIKIMREHKMTLSELDAYSTARHAAERNDWIATFNDDMQDGGSGMTYKEAADILEALADRTGFEEAFAIVRAVYDQTLDDKVAGGHITQDYVDGLRARWPNFVSLKGKAGEDTRQGTGSGYSIRGSGIKKAMGRGAGNRSDSPVAQAFADAEVTVVRTEKSTVGQALVRLIRANPDPELWTIGKRTLGKFKTLFGEAFEGYETVPEGMTENIDYKRVMGFTNEELAAAEAEGRKPIKKTLYKIDPGYAERTGTFAVMYEGEELLINLKDEVMAEQMKRMNLTKLNAVVRGFGTLNRYLAMINTAINPEFVVTNFERDYTTAMTHLAGEWSPEIAAKVTKGIPGAIRGIWQSTFDTKGTSEWRAEFDEMQKEGGTIGFFGLEDVETKMNKIHESLESMDGAWGRTKQGVRAVRDVILDANLSIENASRLSAYKVIKEHLLEKGLAEVNIVLTAENFKQVSTNFDEFSKTIDQGYADRIRPIIKEAKAGAASVAKNLTVNFNRKGELAPFLNSGWLFYNATVQGSARILLGAMKHKGVQKIAAGMAVAGFANAMLNRNLAGEDDDDIPRWDKMSEFLKQTNILFMKPDGSGEAYKIKLPYGYNVFWYTGVALHDLIYDPRKSVPRVTMNMLGAIMNAFNPWNGSDLVDTIMPTSWKPFTQHETNKNFMGAKVKPEFPFDNYDRPESQKFYPSTNKLLVEFTNWMNTVSGGDEQHPGAVDISPEVMKHYLGWVTGGAGMFAFRSVDTITKLASGDVDEIEARGVPMARTLFAKQSKYFDKERYYTAVKEVNAVKQRLDFLKGTDAYADYKSENYLVHQLTFRMKSFKNKIKRLRNEQSKAYADDDRDFAKEKGEEIRQLMMEFSVKYDEAIEGQE